MDAKMKTEITAAPGVKDLGVIWGDPPTHIRLYQWTGMAYVGLYSVTEHYSGDECECQYRPEGRCSPHSPIPESSHMAVWRDAQICYGISPLALLIGLITKTLGYTPSFAEFEIMEKAMNKFLATKIPPEEEAQ